MATSTVSQVNAQGSGQNPGNSEAASTNMVLKRRVFVIMKMLEVEVFEGLLSANKDPS